MHDAEQSKVGLLNDLHYDGGVEALNRLYESVAALNQGGAELLVVMGDLIDADSEMNAKRLLREVSALCDSFRGTVRYMPGNHDLDHLSKAQFHEALGRGDEASIFCCRQGGVGFICMDGNFSPNGREYDHGHFDWRDSFVPAEQLEWLAKQLAAATGPVIVLSHQRIDIACMHSVRNYESVLEVIRKSGKVKAVFQGHQHADDLRKIDGTTYYTLSAHMDGAGPAMIHVGSRGIRLMRDYQALELA
jgi:3',5'-cyclic AMP phosphodiesterase CpdA